MSDYQGLTGDNLVLAIADDIFSSINILRRQFNSLEKIVMIDLDQVLTEVQSQSAMITQLSLAVVALEKHVNEHADGTIIAPAVQEKINALMDSAVSNKALLADAVKLAVNAVQAVEAVKAQATTPNLA